MKNTTVLLVDDENLALGLLENFCQRLPGLEVVGRFRSPADALGALHAGGIDILFLDIQMPVMSGSNLLRALPRPPATIFTTAYADHAAEAFDLNAVDYLLKPFSFERFVQAVGKARAFLNQRDAPPPAAPLQPASPSAGAMPFMPAAHLFVEKKEAAHLVVKVDGRLEKVFFDEITMVEGMREYVRIVCAGRSLVTLESMKNLEAALPTADFVRPHKSFIVAKKAVRALDGGELVLEKVRVPVSRERREEVRRAIFGR